MVTENRLSVCDGVRNPRNLNLVVECIECGLKIRMTIDAVFELLTDN